MTLEMAAVLDEARQEHDVLIDWDSLEILGGVPGTEGEYLISVLAGAPGGADSEVVLGRADAQRRLILDNEAMKLLAKAAEPEADVAAAALADPELAAPPAAEPTVEPAAAASATEPTAEPVAAASTATAEPAAPASTGPVVQYETAHAALAASSPLFFYDQGGSGAARDFTGASWTASAVRALPGADAVQGSWTLTAEISLNGVACGSHQMTVSTNAGTSFAYLSLPSMDQLTASVAAAAAAAQAAAAPAAAPAPVFDESAAAAAERTFQDQDTAYLYNWDNRSDARAFGKVSWSNPSARVPMGTNGWTLTATLTIAGVDCGQRQLMIEQSAGTTYVFLPSAMLDAVSALVATASVITTAAPRIEFKTVVENAQRSGDAQFYLGSSEDSTLVIDWEELRKSQPNDLTPVANSEIPAWTFTAPVRRTDDEEFRKVEKVELRLTAQRPEVYVPDNAFR
jgi:hypothetical protein